METLGFPIPRRVLLSLPLLLPISTAHARGLFEMPPAHLTNRYFLVRSGESLYESNGIIMTNPVAKTSVDSGLSAIGMKQAAKVAAELKRIGACDASCWIWPSITQRSYQTAEIIAYVNGIDRRSKVIPPLSYYIIRGISIKPSLTPCWS